MGSDFWWLKCQYDSVSRNPGFDQLLCNPAFRAIMLYPDFAISNVNVQHAPMDPIWSIPASVHQFVMIVGFVKDHLYLHVSSCWPVLCILPDKVLNDSSVAV